MTLPWHTLSIAEVGRKLRQREVTSVELTRHYLARIEQLDPAIHAYVHVARERALQDARAADEELQAGRDHGPLHGIPYALKDLYETQGVPTTCHSHLFTDHVPRHDSEVVRRLRSQHAVMLGKVATHEFAIGWPGKDLPFPAARNPWNTDYIPGGSSTGSGAAVAARMARVALSTDTAGSIRWPASFCGVVGLKPTFGRVSRRGVFPLSGTLDHCGPVAASVEDAALTLQAIAGHDPQDPASADVPVPDFRAGLHAGVKGLRIGVPRHFFEDSADPEVIEAFDRAMRLLRAGGAIVTDVELPDYETFSACGRVIMLAEAFAIHRRNLRERPQLFGSQTRNRVLLGAGISSSDLLAAYNVQRHLAQRVQAALQSLDALITVTTLGPAVPFEARYGAGHNPVSGTSTLQGFPFTLTGLPAMSVPLELNAAGLPLALQVAGHRFDEQLVIRVGRYLEANSGWESVRLPIE